MNISKNKSKLSTIALILLLTLSATLIALPSAVAQSSQVTYPFLGVVPNPVGVNQVILLHVGIFQQLSQVQMGWEDMTITILRPDGQTDTLSDIKTDSTGGTGVTYTPTQVGTYTLQAHFPEQLIVAGEKTAPGIPTGTVMLASDSTEVLLVVQADSIAYYPSMPLPSEYWTRPIDPQLREWSAVLGNWLEPGFTAPTVVSGNEAAPDSAHILWAKPLTMGGIAGGVGEDWAFSHGDAYEGKFTSRMIINGILIYNHRTNDRPLTYTALDLQTGEELWTKTFLDNRTIAFGQNLVWGNHNHHAVYSYLWVTVGSTWTAFDPGTGEMQFSVTNVPGGETLTDENGWLYRVSISTNSGTGYVWSMVDLIQPFEDETSSNKGSWLPAGSFYGGRYGTYDAAAEAQDGNLTTAAQSAYISEFTVDGTNIGGIGGYGGSDRAWAYGDKVFGLEYSRTEIKTWAVSLEPGNEGDVLFAETWAAPAYWETGQVQIEFEAVSLEEGAAVLWVKDTLEHYGFSTDTGEYMFGPTEPEVYQNYYGWTEFGERPNIIWEGKFYSSGTGGVIYCFDMTDGSTLWTYSAEDPYQEYLFANNWWQFFQWIVDGKLYTGHMEHSAIEPMPRGAPFLCLDATTGELVWEAPGLFRSTRWGGRNIIGDSIMVGMDTYDNQLYAVGKGPSTITAQSPLVSVQHGTSVTIEGTVTDVSPGTNSDRIKLRFPNGVPAMSDESMSDWMLYVYKQFPKPYATGVTVTIETVDPNMNYQVLGTATSDATGHYGFSFEPEVPGDYIIMATFYGSDSYYGSTTTTYLTVDPAPEPYPTVTIPPYPGYQGPSASEVAQNVLSNLPDNPTSSDIAQEVLNQLPETTEAPEYTTMDLIILVAVAVAIVISLVSLLRKQK